MGVWDALFGVTDDTKDKMKQLWTDLRSMPPTQLKDIIRYKRNSVHGFLAAAILFSNASHDDLFTTDEPGGGGGIVDRSDVTNGLDTLMRNDIILLGIGKEFDDMRATIKKAMKRLRS